MWEESVAVLIEKSESISIDECSGVVESESDSGVVPLEEGERWGGGGSNGAAGGISFLNKTK